MASKASSGANACREAHAFIGRWNLAWKIPYSYLPLQKKDGSQIEVPYISPKDYLKFLLGKAPHLLYGGLDDLELGAKHWECFWNHYREIHPTHVLFEASGNTERRLSNTIGLAFYGDEGRGLKRGNTCIITMETVLGLMDPSNPRDSRCCESCCVSKSTAKRYDLREGFMASPNDLGEIPLFAQHVSNYKHHSFLTKYALSILPHSYFKETDLLERLMGRLCQDFRELFESGLETGQGKVFAALTGMKGDLKWYQSIANLSRCFAKQLKPDEPCCHQCMAGTADMPFEQTTHNPDWAQTMFFQRPWAQDNEPQAITNLPFDAAAPERILRRDVFHNAKQGTFRDYIASTVLLLCLLGYFHDSDGSNSRDALLGRAHAHFSLWCCSTGKTPALRSFNSLFFSITSWSDYPWINCKGSDTSLCVSWLRCLTRCLLFDLKDPEHKQTLESMHQAAVQGERFFKIVYTHGIWLSRHCAAATYEALHLFLKEYNTLSFLSLYKHAYTGYAKKTKMHMLAHEKYDLHMLLVGKRPVALNPVIFATEQNEDTVGRLSRLSRRVSQHWPAKRTLDLYLIQCKTVHRRYLAVRKTKGKLKRKS